MFCKGPSYSKILDLNSSIGVLRLAKDNPAQVGILSSGVRNNFPEWYIYKEEVRDVLTAFLLLAICHHRATVTLLSHKMSVYIADGGQSQAEWASVSDTLVNSLHRS